MKPLIVIIAAITVISAAYAAPDLSCEAILNPPGDYVLADSTIAPKLKITNLGDQGASDFWVFFKAVRTSDDSTVYLDSTQVGYLGPSPESIELELMGWIPQGKCDKDKTKVGEEYELFGFPSLSTDADNSNDTLFTLTTSLLVHDVGVTNLVLSPEPTGPPWIYPAGTVVTVTAIVENFGFSLEYNVPVRLEIVDKIADPDTFVWQNTQVISALDCRNAGSDSMFTTDVVFPTFTIPSLNYLVIVCKTELVGDMCPDNDIGPIREINKPIALEEDNPSTARYDLDVTSRAHSIRFALPSPSWVRLDVFDASGRFVRNLYNDPCLAGSHSLTWDRKDSHGVIVSSGAYFIKMQAGDFGEVKKTLIVR